MNGKERLIRRENPNTKHHSIRVLLVASTMLVSCNDNRQVSEPNTQISPTTTRTTESPAPTLSVATTALEKDCQSVRAVRPGAYFNPSYADQIDDQLRLIRLAKSPAGNVDLDDDFISLIRLYHAMEEDPLYADAMTQTYATLSNQPDKTISTRDFLAQSVPPAELCAPATLTDTASRRQLTETKLVIGGVSDGLIHHLGRQATRSTQLAIDFFQLQWQKIENKLDQQLAGN